MFNKFLLILLVFISFLPDLRAGEKELIVKRLKDITNITFEFQQTTNTKKETGICILVFDNKLSCNYHDSTGKEVLINGKTLVVTKKKYNKIYFYPLSNSLFTRILNKNNLINLIQKTNYVLNDNIELVYVGKNKKKITIIFDKNSFDFIGWKVKDQLQNEINFSLKIKSINGEYNPKIFEIPKAN